MLCSVTGRLHGLVSVRGQRIFPKKIYGLASERLGKKKWSRGKSGVGAGESRKTRYVTWKIGMMHSQTHKSADSKQEEICTEVDKIAIITPVNLHHIWPLYFL